MHRLEEQNKENLAVGDCGMIRERIVSGDKFPKGGSGDPEYAPPVVRSTWPPTEGARDLTYHTGDGGRQLCVFGIMPRMQPTDLMQHFSRYGSLDRTACYSTRRANYQVYVITYAQESSVEAAQLARPHVVARRALTTRRRMPGLDIRSGSALVTTRHCQVWLSDAEVAPTAEDVQEWLEGIGRVEALFALVEKGSTDEVKDAEKLQVMKVRQLFVTFSDYDMADKLVITVARDGTVGGAGGKAWASRVLVQRSGRASMHGPGLEQGMITISQQKMSTIKQQWHQLVDQPPQAKKQEPSSGMDPTSGHDIRMQPITRPLQQKHLQPLGPRPSVLNEVQGDFGYLPQHTNSRGMATISTPTLEFRPLLPSFASFAHYQAGGGHVPCACALQPAVEGLLPVGPDLLPGRDAPFTGRRNLMPVFSSECVFPGNNGDDADEDRRDGDGVAGEEKRGGSLFSSRQLLVAGLSPATGEDKLAAMLSYWGPVQRATIFRGLSNTTLGYGFVLFERAESVDSVQQARPHIIDQVVVETRRMPPIELIGKAEASLLTNRLQVKFPASVGRAEMSSSFEKFGKIEYMMYRPATTPDGRGEAEEREEGGEENTEEQDGMAMLVFEDFDVVDKILITRNHAVNGHTIVGHKYYTIDELENHIRCKQLDPPNTMSRCIDSLQSFLPHVMKKCSSTGIAPPSSNNQHVTST